MVAPVVSAALAGALTSGVIDNAIKVLAAMSKVFNGNNPGGDCAIVQQRLVLRVIWTVEMVDVICSIHVASRRGAVDD